MSLLKKNRKLCVNNSIIKNIIDPSVIYYFLLPDYNSHRMTNLIERFCEICNLNREYYKSHRMTIVMPQQQHIAHFSYIIQYNLKLNTKACDVCWFVFSISEVICSQNATNGTSQVPISAEYRNMSPDVLACVRGCTAWSSYFAHILYH